MSQMWARETKVSGYENATWKENNYGWDKMMTGTTFKPHHCYHYKTIV